MPATSLSRSRATPGHPLGNMENRRCTAVNPLSWGVTATPKKTEFLRLFRDAEGLANGPKPSSVPGDHRQSIAPKELVSSNPLEGALHTLQERSLLATASKQRTE